MIYPGRHGPAPNTIHNRSNHCPQPCWIYNKKVGAGRMSEFHLVHLTSAAALRNAATAWDDLWWRSDVTLPTVRAELLAQWLEQFGGKAEFHALAVESGGHWVAALPLVSRRIAGVIRAGSLPCNPWLPCGDLLIDPTA